MFELVDSQKNKQVAFSNDDSINIDNLKLTERVYFVQSAYRVFSKPKYIEFTSIFADDLSPHVLIDFLTGVKVIYGYTCYNTTTKYPMDNEPYEHSITFVQNK